MPQGGVAKYSVAVPKQDGFGNPLPDVASAAHHYISQTLKVQQATIHRAHPVDQVIVYAEDTPEMDSHMKQVAAYVGEVANQQAVFVSKEGKQGIQTWTIANPQYA